jgi:hypothetical protein
MSIPSYIFTGSTMKHYWLVLEVKLTERVIEKLGTSQNIGYVLLQRCSDGNHFKKKIYLTRLKADRDGYVPMKLYNNNI